MKITKMGKTSFQTPSIHRSRSLTLNNVLVVPQITKNLVNVSQFTKDNNVAMEFDESFCFVRDKTMGRRLLSGRLHNGLYQLRETTPTHSQYSSTSRNSQTNSSESLFSTNWSILNSTKYVSRQPNIMNVKILHNRLGHPSLGVLDIVVRLSSMKVSALFNLIFVLLVNIAKTTNCPFKNLFIVPINHWKLYILIFGVLHPLHQLMAFVIIYTLLMNLADSHGFFL